MLAEISIRNFAIIESLTVSFEKGLTVLTGETGAGKSIIIDAISLLAGGRGSSEFVRYGEKKAEIEGLFLLDHEKHPCVKKCEEFGIDLQDGMVILRRDIGANGKSVCRVNGKLVTIAVLREIGRLLVDIHGQHDNQELMDEHHHLHLLDEFGGEEVKRAKGDYLELYNRYVELSNRLKRLSDNEQEMAHRLDLIQFQLNEIESAGLEPEEDVRLQEERKQIVNFEKVYKAMQNAYNALQGDQRGLDWLGVAMSHLEDVADINDTLQTLSETVSNHYYIIEDITYQLRNELDTLEFDPERLNTIESRLNEINHLKRKYGHSVDEILAYAAKIEEEIETLTNRDSHIHKIREELQSIRNDLLVEAKNISKIRKKWAKTLTEKIMEELKALYMDKTTFSVQFLTETEDVNFTQEGIDRVEFYISTNPGEPVKTPC